jgi:hypothetical protein
MKIFIFIIFLGLLTSCENYHDLIEIPFFEIKLELTETAEKYLTDNNETIIVVASFSSDFDDIDKIPRRYRNIKEPYRMYFLIHRIELTDTRLAKFENLKIPKGLYDLLERDIDISINVYSGRKSTDLNILDVATLIGPMNEIKEKRFTLNGGLIHEGIIRNHIHLKI